MARSWTRQRFGALTIGLIATLVGGMVYSLGCLDRLNGYNLDLHFRHFNTIEADPRIVLIDIDDSTLQAMPDWPWPRRVFAQLVRTLHKMGAQSIVLDIVFAEPSRPRIEHAGIGKHYDIDAAFTELGDRARDEVIYDDDELRDAIRSAGNVFLTMYGDVRLPEMKPDPSTGDRRTTARQFLRQNPDGTWEQFRKFMLTGEPADAQTPEREALLMAFRHALSMRAIDRKLPPVPAGSQSATPKMVHGTPPLEKLVEAAKGVGLVSFRRDSEEGTVRKLPLVVNADGVTLPQLGVLAAMDRLGFPLKDIAIGGNKWMYGPRANDVFVEMDHTGTSLVNWYRPPGEDWRSAFAHVPAAWLFEERGQARARYDNEMRAILARAELVRARHSETPAAYIEYVQQVNARHYLDSPKPRPSLLKLEGSITVAQPNPYHNWSREVLTAAIESTEREAVLWLQRAWGLWRDEGPENAEEQTERDHIKGLYDRFGEGQYLGTLERANERLHRRMLERGNERPALNGKICLVGYTATAMADMVPTPVDPAMPGVMVHANVINMFLQNRFATEASRGVHLALIGLAGLLTTLTSCARGTRFSILALFGLVAVIIGVGAAIFWTFTYHIASFIVVALVILVWASVTVYRQATEERARRAFQRALAQYTSPAVAARIADRTKADDLAPQKAVVTCFFSDLADFTRLSERLGPRETRGLLNPYLRGVSSALFDHHAIVNKFMGDGVFAFFNAPILPCPNHAQAACQSALESLAAVARSNDDRRQSDQMDSLTVRIGLSTGEAFVGDYGGDMKLDYTCIGDTVNLGSRLEQANKVFGTAILVDDATRKEAGDGFVFRSLGLIEVAGKAAAVAVHELVGLVNEMDDSARQYIAMFEQAIHDYQHCRWDSCLTTLADCRKLRPLDRAVGLYEQAAARRRSSPNAADLPCVIEIGRL